MPGPTLSPAEIAQLTKDKKTQEGAAAAYQSLVAGQQAEAAELAVSDGAFKKFFDYYDADIIQKYDLEQRWINGRIITDPIVEADILAVAELSGGRCQPSLPATDVIRISQFDGTPITTDPINELQHIADQIPRETHLTAGWPGTALALTVLTTTTIGPATTMITLSGSAVDYVPVIGQVYVIEGASTVAVFQVDTVTPTPGGPPFIKDLGITMIVPPTGTIAIGQTVKIFTGFNNAERTTKTAALPKYQGLMNYLVAQLQAIINLRITTLNNQLPSIAANQDPDGVAQLAAATSNVNASKTFLTNYLITTDVSNTGLTSLSGERVSRTTQANTRVSQITTAYTGQTKNYYNERYNAANNRGNTSRGTLRLQKNAEQTASTSQGFADSATALAGAIGDILP